MLTGARADGKVALKILKESPLDEGAWKADGAAELEKVRQWVPSRYNVRATMEDGRLILWNTLSQAMSVFKLEQAPYVVALLKAPGFEARKEGLAGYLVERGFLVRKGTDEYRKFLLSFGQQHYQSDRLELFVLSSEDCNFRCTYCYEKFARGTMLPEVRTGIKNLVKKRIKSLRMLDVRWFGGEPLYGWDAIADLGPFFHEIAEENKVPYMSHMTTNGYLLTPEVVDDLFAWRINLFQITVDGLPEDHDCHRPTRDGQGTFQTIFENLRSMAARKDDFTVNLRVNFDKDNHGRLEQFIDLVKTELGGDPRFRINFFAIGRWGGPNDPQLAVCGEDESEKVTAQMKALAHSRGLQFNTLRDVNFLGGQVCYAARPFNLIIGASGKVMKCTVVLDEQENNVVGQITEDGRLNIDEDRMALWTEPAFERDSQCQKCVVLPSCQGISCPLPRINKDERPCVPTRTRAKSELAEMLKYPGATARTRSVLERGAPRGKDGGE